MNREQGKHVKDLHPRKAQPGQRWMDGRAVQASQDRRNAQSALQRSLDRRNP